MKPVLIEWEGDDMGLLEREIGAIQELLDQEPDSKCGRAYFSKSVSTTDVTARYRVSPISCSL